MEIKFIRSNCPDPHNGDGYMVWTNQYSDFFKCVGFTSTRNLNSIKEYYLEQGFMVSVIEDPENIQNKAYQTVIEGI